MKHFLKDNNDKTIIESQLLIENKKIEVTSSLDIFRYSKFLLNQPKKNQNKIILYLENIMNINLWLWKTYSFENDFTFTIEEQIDIYENTIINFYQKTANILNLNYITE